MAGKQLGKLRQWAGEVISSREKTVVTDEFRELEQDIALRKHGVDRLNVASKAYHHSLSKKKDSEAVDDADKLLPMDALGVVMISHGEQFGEESAFGSSLVKLGRAHCKIATLQEAYALTLEDTYLASIETSADELRDYQSQRKKLDSRRLAFDAAISKAEKLKSSKKEKDKKDAEEELVKARLRFEETSEDVRKRMYAIQENEIRQLRDLTSFLELETKFVEQYLDVLRDVKSDWCDETRIERVDHSRPLGPTHSFRRPIEKKAYNSIRPTSISLASGHAHGPPSPSPSNEDNGPFQPQPQSLVRTRTKSDAAPSTKLTRSGSKSKPPSRPVSRGRPTSSGGVGNEKDEKDEKRSRKMSVVGWASGAVSSVTGRGKGKGKKDRDAFAALRDKDEGMGGRSSEEEDDDDDDEEEEWQSSHSHVSSKSAKNRSKRNSPLVPSRILQTASSQPQQNTIKVVRAICDFSGSSDELSFRAGDEIIVVNELLEGWSMGELRGRTALFPTLHTETIIAGTSKPALPSRTSLPSFPSLSQDESRDSGSDMDDVQPFGDHHIAMSRSPVNGLFDQQSILSSVDDGDDDDEHRMVPDSANSGQNIFDDAPFQHNNFLTASVTAPIKKPPPSLTGSSSISSTSSSRKAPPPPPPARRSTNNVHASLSAPTPPARSKSASSLPLSHLAHGAAGVGRGESPFDTQVQALGGCHEFRQNPFKQQGFCSNCMRMHS